MFWLQIPEMEESYTDRGRLHRGFNVNKSFDYQHRSLQNTYSHDNNGRFGYDLHSENNSPRDFIEMRGGQYLSDNINASHSRDNNGKFGYSDHSLQYNSPRDVIEMRGGQYFSDNINAPPPRNYRGRTDSYEIGYAGRRFNSRHDHGNQRIRHHAAPYFIPQGVQQNNSLHNNIDWVNPSFAGVQFQRDHLHNGIPSQDAGNQFQSDEIATLNLRIAELMKSNSDMAIRCETLAKSNAEMSIRIDGMQSGANRVGSGSSSLSTHHQDPEEFSDGENSTASGNKLKIFFFDYLGRFTRTRAVFSIKKKITMGEIFKHFSLGRE